MDALTLRSLVVVPWLMLLFARGGRDVATAVLVLALLVIWAVAMVRDRRARLTGLEVRGTGTRVS